MIFVLKLQKEMAINVRYILKLQNKYVISATNNLQMAIMACSFSKATHFLMFLNYRVRIQEGFHFGQTNSGMITMVLELDMKVTRIFAFTISFCKKKAFYPFNNFIFSFKPQLFIHHHVYFLRYIWNIFTISGFKKNV